MPTLFIFSKRLMVGVTLISLALLSACNDRGGDGAPQFNPDFVDTDDPNRFMQFLNLQMGLSAGDYQIVAGTETSGQSGSFSITVTKDDNASQTFTGTWTNSGGQDAASSNNPKFSFSQMQAGGIHIRINSSVNTCLYLLDRNDRVIKGQAGTDTCTTPTEIAIARSLINNTANAEAYYRTVDPDNTRDTLEKWKQANGFGTPCGASNRFSNCEVHVIFRDTKDLGYGRNMFARHNANGSVAVYVENFQVNAVPGQAYTNFNLTAAINNDRQWHFGSNAIEFSTYPYGVGEPKEIANAPMFAKFYTFKPDVRLDPNTTERRLSDIDLDSRGLKSMPGPCISCHGGTARPVLPNGEYPPYIPGGIAGDVDAQLQVLEVDSFGYSDAAGYSRAELEDKLRIVNQFILSTYEKAVQQNRAGHSNGQYLRELAIGHYSTADATDPAHACTPSSCTPYTLPNTRYNGSDSHSDDYVPVGWRPNIVTGTPPIGADTLFREVIAANCVVCHSRRGHGLGSNQNINSNGADVDFSTYEKFIGHADQLETYIFDRGIMPLALLNFDNFWDSVAPSKPQLLSNFLPGFSHGNSDGSINQPGKAVAVPVAPSRSKTPMTLSGEGSYYSNSYQWTITDRPVGANPFTSFTNTNTPRPTFDTTLDGDYTFQLITSNDKGSSAPATITVTIANSDASLVAPKDLRFETHIAPVFSEDQTPAAPARCTSCHMQGGAAPGVPAYWTSVQPEGRDFYKEVIARVNFKEPIESPLLRKPSGKHHYGDCRPGFDLTMTANDCNGTNGDRSYYDMILSWILEGAVK